MEFKYEDLEKHFIKPKNWTPGKQSFFDHYKRIPRKLKKHAKRISKTDLPIGNKLWDALYQRNKNYCRFLIKQLLE